MADNPSNYYSEHSGSHVIEDYCSNSKGGEIYDIETGAHITDESECMQYGDCELIPYDILDEPLFFYSGAQFLIDENACIRINDTFFKLVCWYDNEVGYSHKLIELSKLMFE